MKTFLQSRVFILQTSTREGCFFSLNIKNTTNRYDQNNGGHNCHG